MTVSSETNRIRYDGNNSTTVFPVPMRFLQNADIKAYLIPASGVAVLQVESSDYTLTGAGDASGGTLTMTTAPTSTEELLIIRDPAVLQPLDLVAGEPLPAEELEKALDRTVYEVQRSRDRLDKTIRMPDSVEGSDFDFPEGVTRAGKFAGFDANGKPTFLSGTGNDADLRADLASTDAGKGASLVGLEGQGTVQDAINYVTPEMWGAAGDGSTDDQTALDAAITYAAANDVPLVLSEKEYAHSATLDFSSVYVVISYNATLKPSLDSGAAAKWEASSGTFIEGHKVLGNLTVEWTKDWTKDRISFYIQNVYEGEFHLSSINATKGIELHGDNRGCVHNDIFIGKWSSNLVGIWLSTEDANGWCNANTFHGGFFLGSGSVSGALYESEAGHIYIESSPYQCNGNVFLDPSLEWTGAGFRLARMGGLRNYLNIKYAEVNSGDTTWVVDTGTKNTINVWGVPYLDGYDPTVSGANNRLDVSSATEPTVLGPLGYTVFNGKGTQFFQNNHATKPTHEARNAGGGPCYQARPSSASAPGLVVRNPGDSADSVAIPGAGAWTVHNGVTKVLWRSSAAPSTGTWTRGDIALLDSPGITSGGTMILGWRCVAGGTPGTWVPIYTTGATATAVDLADAGAAINTAGKADGKIVVDLSNGMLVVASGANATDAWKLLSGTTAYTPA